MEPEEREFVVASMHMLRKKDLNSAELDTVRVSKKRAKVEKVQTNEEATVYVKDLDIFVTVHLLEDTPPVLSRGQVCDVRGISYEWTGGQKPHLIKNFKKYHATWRTTCLLSFPVCRVKLPVPVRQFRQLLLHHGTPREPILLRHQ